MIQNSPIRALMQFVERWVITVASLGIAGTSSQYKTTMISHWATWSAVAVHCLHAVTVQQIIIVLTVKMYT